MAVTIERLVAEIEADPTRAIAELRSFDTAIATAVRDHSSDIDVDTADALSDLAIFEGIIEALTRDRTINVDVDRSRVSGATSALGGLSSGLSAVASTGSAATNAVGGAGGGFSGVLKGIADGGAGAAGAVVGLAQGFGTALLGLIPLLAVASVLPGALAAGAAAAGIFTAALLPLVGLLGAVVVAGGAFVAIFGTLLAVLGPVIKAVGAYRTATGDSAGAAEDAAAQQRALADALHQVAMAERAVGKAREALADAPREAAEAIEDGHFRAAQAALNEKKAILALREAQENLNKTQDETASSTANIIQQTDEFTGKVYDIAVAGDEAVSSFEDQKAAQLALEQAQLDVATSKDANSDAQRELSELERKGIKNSDIMVAAQEQMADALYALKKAHEQVALAKKKDTAATKALTDAFAGLSPIGQDFVKFVADEFLPSLSGISKAGQDALLPGIQSGLESFMGVTDEVKGEITAVGTIVGEEFASLMEYLTKPAQQERLTSMFEGINDTIEQMMKLGKPLSDVIISITDAAAPMTTRILTGLNDELDELGDWMRSDNGKKKMTAFFDDAAYFGGLWWDVLKPIGRIIGSIVKAGRPMAADWLTDMGADLEKTAKYLSSPEGQDAIQNYFKDALPTLELVKDLVSDVFSMLFGSSDGGTDSSFYKFLTSLKDDLLPQLDTTFKRLDDSTFLADFTTNMGDLVEWLNKVNWKQIGDDLHALSDGIHSITKAADDEGKSGAVRDLWNLLSRPLLPAPDEKGAFTDMFAGIKEEGTKFWDWYKNDYGMMISDATFNVIQKVKGGWNGLWTWYKDTYSPKVGEVFTSLGTGIETAWNDAIEYLKEQWEAFNDWFKDNLPKLPTPSDIAGGVQDSLNNSPLAPIIPGNYSGGPVSPRMGPSIVGENGPELFMPSQSGRIMTNASSSDLLSSTQSGIDPDDLDRILQRVLDKAKPDVQMDVTMTDPMDPKHLADELAWSLR